MARKPKYPEDQPYDTTDEEVILVSKSQMKREMQQLQQLGDTLLTLKPEVLAGFSLSTPLYDALKEAKWIKHREGKRRQMQFIGKLMRSEPADRIAAIEQFLQRQQQQAQRATQQHHQVERWRDRLLSQSNAIEDFLQQHPQADRQWLRQTLRQSQREQEQNKPPATARKLFHYLKEILQSE